MVNQVKYTYNGMNQDVTKDKHPAEYYIDAKNIKITSTDSQSEYSLINEKGNELIITIPDVTINTSTNKINLSNGTSVSYTNNNEIDTQISNGILPISSNSQKLIGNVSTRKGIVLFTTDNEGMDCIWLANTILEDNYLVTLLYVRNLGFSENNPIQALYNYENENIQKVYWVDGNHQIRFINIEHNSIEGNDLLIDLASASINFVGDISLSQPTIDSISTGGTHTAGMIQYAYNLYNLNSSQTKISPLSELVPLGKGSNLGGGEVNEVVGAVPIISIDNIDTDYNYIRVYAIKYTSYNQIPSISLIDERELGSDSITVYDDGSIISSLSLEEFIFLGSDPVIPQHIESKDNRLFLFNIKTKHFDIPEELDTRAYSFNSSGVSLVGNDVFINQWGNLQGPKTLINTTTWALPTNHDAINVAYNTYIYQANGTTTGGEGKYIKYRINRKSLNNVENYRLFKGRELYRIGIQFYNRLGQISLPKWIADFKVPRGNFGTAFNTLEVTLKPEFYTWLNSYNFESEDDKPVGYKIIRADRTLKDRTVICQGILGSMMVNSPREDRRDNWYTLEQKREDSKIQTKLPNILLRTFEEIIPLKGNEHLRRMQEGSTSPFGDGSTSNPLTEIQFDQLQRKADTYQYTTMYQMYSPEIMFDNISVNPSLKFSIIGGAVNSFNGLWAQERQIANKVVDIEGKTLDKISPHAPGGTEESINGNINFLMDRGLISDTNGSDPDRNVEFLQFYREFNDVIQDPTPQEYSIYGSPEITQRGQGITTYNNNSWYRYSNTLEGFLSDGENSFDKLGQNNRAIISLNSYGAKCLTFVADNGTNANVEPHTRPRMEQLHSNANLDGVADDTVLVSELIRPYTDLYSASIYGGNSYEDKKRTSYIEIGEYKDINSNIAQIDSPGDTYIQTFKFERISKTDVEVYSPGTHQLTELVSVRLETTIDLKNRNDISISEWDSRFQPSYDEYHKYNRVYSQQPNLIKNTDVDFTFKRIKDFDTRIQATKIKIPNETVDSWTDILVNETMDLDGKYGPINGVVNFKDTIYTLQDEAIALISINPRVVINSTEGIPTELGTGKILDDYNYISTKSGTINKWSILQTSTGFYYMDVLNKSWMKFQGQIIGLGDTYGLNSFFRNNVDYGILKEDNPLLKTGVSSGYDPLNNDVFLTLHQGDKSFTLCFNEKRERFVSFHDYKPSIYINKGFKLISINPDNNKLYEHYKGNYNQFYDVYYPSYVTFQMNPEQRDCVFNNIEYKCEMYLNGIDLPKNTLTHIQSWNEYQQTDVTEILLNSNANRKFRNWRVNIPRAKIDGNKSLDRMRGHWIYLKLILENEDNHKMILHDVGLNYTPYSY